MNRRLISFRSVVFCGNFLLPALLAQLALLGSSSSATDTDQTEGMVSRFSCVALPLAVEPSRRQIPSPARSVALSRWGEIFLSATSAVIRLPRDRVDDPLGLRFGQDSLSGQMRKAAAFSTISAAAKSGSSLVGDDQLSRIVNSFLRNDPECGGSTSIHGKVNAPGANRSMDVGDERNLTPKDLPASPVAFYYDAMGNLASVVGAGQVPPPQLLPGTGIYACPQKVQITDPDNAATILYTTGNGAPATPYTGPIVVPSGETIRAIAVDSNFNPSQSAVVAATYSCASAQPMPPTNLEVH
jgi:hypothetical protein